VWQEKRQLMAKMKRLERDNARQAADLARREALEAVRFHDTPLLVLWSGISLDVII
jgi:hypothetical protein